MSNSTSNGAKIDQEFLEFHTKCLEQLGSDPGSSGVTQIPAEDICQALVGFKKNPHKVLSEATLNLMTAVYVVLFAAGLLANLSVCWVVVRNSQARTSRNVYILNLAVSDLMVCFVTMPFTLVRLVRHSESWEYGEAICLLTR